MSGRKARARAKKSHQKSASTNKDQQEQSRAIKSSQEEAIQPGGKQDERVAAGPYDRRMVKVSVLSAPFADRICTWAGSGLLLISAIALFIIFWEEWRSHPSQWMCLIVGMGYYIFAIMKQGWLVLGHFLDSFSTSSDMTYFRGATPADEFDYEDEFQKALHGESKVFELVVQKIYDPTMTRVKFKEVLLRGGLEPDTAPWKRLLSMTEEENL